LGPYGVLHYWKITVHQAYCKYFGNTYLGVYFPYTTHLYHLEHYRIRGQGIQTAGPRFHTSL
jgi:hypothetical protein